MRLLAYRLDMLMRRDLNVYQGYRSEKYKDDREAMLQL